MDYDDQNNEGPNQGDINNLLNEGYEAFLQEQNDPSDKVTEEDIERINKISSNKSN